MSKREQGVYQNGDYWMIVFPSKETQSGFRALSLPTDAWRVIDAHFNGRSGTTVKKTRRDGIIQAIHDHPGVEFGTLITHTLINLGEDTEDMSLRRQIGGLLQTLRDDGTVRIEGSRAEKNERFYLS